MARHLPWTAWILFFAGLPLAVAGDPSFNVCKYLGWGWSGGNHWCSPNSWYVSPYGSCMGNAGCSDCGISMSPWDGPMSNPAQHAAARYYIPTIAYQPTSPPRERTASAISSPMFTSPSTLQSR